MEPQVFPDYEQESTVAERHHESLLTLNWQPQLLAPFDKLRANGKK